MICGKRVKMVDSKNITDSQISEITRRAVFDFIREEQLSWSGRLSEVEFLARLYDLDRIPSTDGRFCSARGDIWQHRVNNYDWDEDWILDDSRFNLLRGSEKNFTDFLCAIVHPVVRVFEEQVLWLVQNFNEHLERDGWELYESARISGRPIYAARSTEISRPASLMVAAELVEEFDSEYLRNQIRTINDSIQTNPSLAIGTAKEFVESCCKTILRERGNPTSEKLDIPSLLKLVRTELKLLPEDIPHHAKGAETIRKLLSNLGTLAQSLGELRSLYGTGHGKDGAFKGLSPRHARLAVGASTTLAVFLFETHKERNKEPTASEP